MIDILSYFSIAVIGLFNRQNKNKIILKVSLLNWWWIQRNTGKRSPPKGSKKGARLPRTDRSVGKTSIRRMVGVQDKIG